MDVWLGGYFQDTSIGVHGGCLSEGCSNLAPIIRDHTAPGTIIHSDEWAAYRRVQSLPNVAGHGVVKHSLHFVEPTTGVHTQPIESYWSQVKTKPKRMRGCHAHQLPSYLDEYMWRERYGETARDALHNILHHISQQYPL